MKKLTVAFCLLLLSLLILLPVTADGNTVSLETMTISEDGSAMTAHIALTESFAEHHDTLYLFRVLPDHNGVLTGMTPLTQAEVSGLTMTVSLPYNAADPSSALYGYILARADENGSYLPMSEVVYPENFTEFAPHQQDYPVLRSKKGLQVQLSTDAQLLGVKHTVVNAFFNELITSEETEKAHAFVYGGKTYYLDAAVLSALDYRIRSLTDAGIHIYLNYLLAFDPEAPSSLYYPQAQGNASTLYAPNVSTPEGIKHYAAVIHFLADRYSSPDGNNGFCGSYILGYEMNQARDRHSMGVTALSDYAAQCAILLRTADTAVRSAYANGRVFVSLSNRWDVTNDDAVPYLFGSKELLDQLVTRCGDIPFGVSINPYPSDLTMTDFWKDDRATDDLETPYLTIKNLHVLTEYLKTDTMLWQGNPRPVLVGELGLSGKKDVSEELQAAAYLLAYHNICQNDGIESFIWHRHVDHAGEKDLYYGLYASSELLLEPTTSKLLYTVFSVIDADGLSPQLRERLLPLLPEGTAESLNIPQHRVIHSVSATEKSKGKNQELLFDFSQSLYTAYPTDNAAYLEHHEEDGNAFLRTSLIHVSSKEYMGIGLSLVDMIRLNRADAITVRLRVVSEQNTADIRLLLDGEKDGQDIILDGTASVSCGKWVDVTFSLASFAQEALSSGSIKLWTRLPSGASEELFLDVSSVSLQITEKTGTLGLALTVLSLLALAGVLFFLVYLVFFGRHNRHTV